MWYACVRAAERYFVKLHQYQVTDHALERHDEYKPCPARAACGCCRLWQESGQIGNVLNAVKLLIREIELARRHNGRRDPGSAGVVYQWLLTCVAASPDPRCPETSCCQRDDGACWRHGLWTRAYCCALGGAADCYRWGEDSPGQIVSCVNASSQCLRPGLD